MTHSLPRGITHSRRGSSTTGGVEMREAAEGPAEAADAPSGLGGSGLGGSGRGGSGRGPCPAGRACFALARGGASLATRGGSSGGAAALPSELSSRFASGTSSSDDSSPPPPAAVGAAVVGPGVAKAGAAIGDGGFGVAWSSGARLSSMRRRRGRSGAIPAKRRDHAVATRASSRGMQSCNPIIRCPTAGFPQETSPHPPICTLTYAEETNTRLLRNRTPHSHASTTSAAAISRSAQFAHT